MRVGVGRRKVPTVSRKTERLINLTIALLATKRYLTKSEIFKSVEGYEGSNDSIERMFERDKDDLRTIGIVIDVGSFDPLFNDEQGYRIRQEDYQLDLGPLSHTELSLLSLAANAWKGAALGDVAQRGLRKLSSLGIHTDVIDLPALSVNFVESSQDLVVITSAIQNSDFLHFEYIGRDLSVSTRKIVPFSLKTKSGFWYIVGVDHDNFEVRTFRLDRIVGQIGMTQNTEPFEPPDDVQGNLETPVSNAVIDVRKGKCHSLRGLASSTKDCGEWDQIIIPILSLENLCSAVLWHGEDAFVVGPIQLRDRIVYHLEQLVENHG